MTSAVADLTVRDRRGRIAAVVEIKSRRSGVDELATRYMTKALRDLPEPTPYFLLITQESVYIWRNPNPDQPTQPALVLPTRHLLDRFWPDRDVDQPIAQSQLEFVAQLWLNDLVNSFPSDYTNGPLQQLAQLGLIEAIHGGSIVGEAEQ